jgi:hypothetical protein
MDFFPKEVVYHILTFTKHFKVRKGKLVQLIPYDDPRRALLRTLPRIDNNAHVLLKRPEGKYFEWHVVVDVLAEHVKWSLIKFYVVDTFDNEDLMDGVVFLMARQSGSALF